MTIVRQIIWAHTILDHDIETLLNEQVMVEDDQSEGEWKDVVAASNFEELANVFLYPFSRVIIN